MNLKFNTIIIVVIAALSFLVLAIMAWVDPAWRAKLAELALTTLGSAIALAYREMQTSLPAQTTQTNPSPADPLPTANKE